MVRRKLTLSDELRFGEAYRGHMVHRLLLLLLKETRDILNALFSLIIFDHFLVFCGIVEVADRDTCRIADHLS